MSEKECDRKYPYFAMNGCFDMSVSKDSDGPTMQSAGLQVSIS
jgi:hypothetical protein